VSTSANEMTGAESFMLWRVRKIHYHYED